MILATALAGTSTQQLREKLPGRRAMVAARLGPAAEIAFGIRHPDDPMKAIGGGRQVESADAILQFTYPSGSCFADIIVRLSGLASDLDGLVDIGRSAPVFGRNLVLTEGSGNVLFGFVSRRRPGMTLEAMRSHWLEHHAPLAISVFHKLVPHGYDQVHVDPELSERACEAAGIPYVPYDMADSVRIQDLGKFARVVADEELQRPLYEDEKHFLDHSSWRGLFTEMI